MSNWRSLSDVKEPLSWYWQFNTGINFSEACWELTVGTSLEWVRELSAQNCLGKTDPTWRLLQMTPSAPTSLVLCNSTFSYTLTRPKDLLPKTCDPNSQMNSWCRFLQGVESDFAGRWFSYETGNCIQRKELISLKMYDPLRISY